MSDASTLGTNAVRGETAGVPFVALPPERARVDASTVIVWHMHDPPRSETAMAAALPLRGVGAWRVYLGLPLSGSRLPDGGLDGFFALGYKDAVLNLYAPTVRQAVDEFPTALAELHRRNGLADGPIAVVGASIGALVALSVVAAGELPLSAVALVSPALRLTSVVAANERRFGVTYPWSDDARAVASELDFVARAAELARHGAPTLLVVGGEDDHEGIVRPAEELVAALVHEGVEATLVRIPEMAHAIADEPGLEPAPQSATAAAVDDVVARWLRERLAKGGVDADSGSE
ncbi:MAG TPA: alpha/beta hydrolase fold domain-containing protein [Gaiellaceae bacterium]|nr:alpha/beta hydrolase fold domain-containing protein [Gaiellaceae bacterium]